MIEPTQAQIEAAAKAVEEAYKCYGTEFTTIAICAITAAAEANPVQDAEPSGKSPSCAQSGRTVGANPATGATQAQIEAAKKAFWNTWPSFQKWWLSIPDSYGSIPNLENVPDEPFEAALTAAAEVGEQDELESGVLLTKAIDEVIAEDVEKERLQELVSQGIQIERQLRKELLTLRAATIERCAQVAKAAKERAIEEYRQRIKENDASADYYLWCRDEADEIESAIRALKEKP